MFIPGDIDNRDTSKAYLCGMRWTEDEGSTLERKWYNVFKIGVLDYRDGEWCFNGWPMDHLSNCTIVCDFCIEVDRL